MSRFYSCCGGEKAWSHNGHRDNCPYAVAASLKAHPVNQDNLRREIHRRAMKHDQETRRAGVLPDRTNKAIPLEARDERCPAHVTEPLYGCIACADLEVDA